MKLLCRHCALPVKDHTAEEVFDCIMALGFEPSDPMKVASDSHTKITVNARHNLVFLNHTIFFEDEDMNLAILRDCLVDFDKEVNEPINEVVAPLVKSSITKRHKPNPPLEEKNWIDE